MGTIPNHSISRPSALNLVGAYLQSLLMDIQVYGGLFIIQASVSGAANVSAASAADVVRRFRELGCDEIDIAGCGAN
jgi:hypothetical protein